MKPFAANQMKKINETESQVKSRSVSANVGLLLQSKVSLKPFKFLISSFYLLFVFTLPSLVICPQ
jgi:hypothetical protein